MKTTVKAFVLQLAIVGAMISGLGSVAYADNDMVKYQNLTSKAKKTLSQAIGAAESHVSGKAVSAEIDSKLGTVIYEVEVLGKDGVYDVDVDANTGKVLNSRQDVD